ncbi:MAG: hypothetical protein JSS81_10940 [Acidobacteria bacterium]|nr:hypothetical protein [Acidobacteriota bacterium]
MTGKTLALFTLILIVIANGCTGFTQRAVLEETIAPPAANPSIRPEEIPAAEIEAPNLRESDGSLERFIRGEVAGGWLDRDGNRIRPAKDAEGKLLGRLLPAGKKQWELSYAGQVAMDAEIISESNVTTTTVESGDFKSVTKTYRPGEGDRKLALARQYTEESPASLCRNLGGSGIDAADCVQNARRILTTIDRSARRLVDELYRPLLDGKNDAARR